MDRWQLKIIAFLHDPPHKIPAIWQLEKDHRKVAQNLIETLLGPVNIPDSVHQADRLASAMSRIILEQFKQEEEEIGKQIKANNQILLIDPFITKKQFIYVNPEGLDYLVSNFFNRIGQALKSHPEFLFLFLYRIMPEALKDKDGKFSLMMDLPADTRAPNHSLFSHLAQTSALATCLDEGDKPAFFLFTFGPVQEFIATSRKTSDLWAGSFILSYLSFRAAEPLVSALGPEMIIFPNLFRQPIMDFWLREKLQNPIQVDDFQKILLSSTTPDNLYIANIPNRFLCLLPFKLYRDIAKKCEENLSNSWSELVYFAFLLVNNQVEDAYKQVRGEQSGFGNVRNCWNATDDPFWLGWMNQVKNFWDIYWATLPWDNGKGLFGKDPVDSLLTQYQMLLGSDSEDRVNYFQKILSSLYGTYTPNVALCYSLLYDLTERLLGARKNIRQIKEFSGEGRKCSLCGQRDEVGVLWAKHCAHFHEADYDSFNKMVEENFWQPLRKTFRGVLRSGEKLCAVCITRRFAPFYFQQMFQFQNVSYPSTSDIAAAKATNAVIQQATQNTELRKQIEQLIPLLTKLFTEYQMPKTRIPARVWNSIPKYDPLKTFAFIPSELLWKEITAERIGKELGFDSIPENFPELIKNINDIIKNKPFADVFQPSRYYAVLIMDGDEMGKWLAGNKNPQIAQVIHPILEKLSIPFQQGGKTKNLLEEKHPMSPSWHTEFSLRLSTFAVSEVRKTVEDHYGVLIYAGGDDVLALLPCDEVISSAYQIHKKFQEILGDKASMSAGIAIAHAKDPLQTAIQSAREAESNAKTSGRNGFYLNVLKPSGESLSFFSHWEIPRMGKDPLAISHFIEYLTSCFSEEKIAGKFPYDLARNLQGLWNHTGTDSSQTLEICEGEIRRLLKRKSKDSFRESGEFREMEETLILILRNSASFQYLLNLLFLASFISRRGEE
ncbi:MAG: type III-B CRISPR-associated protein Cas10/Cmr2 [bacterium JZ-2024 1]